MTLVELAEKEVRKIQLTGRATFIVSLPKKWVTDMGLESGDQVTIMRQPNNALLILPDIVTKSSNIEATVMVPTNKSGESLKRMVISAYLAGYNVIHVRNKSGTITPQQRDAIREVVRRNLVSTEIIADSSNYITIQVLMSLPELSVSSVLRRMFLIASAMHKDAITALKELNIDLAESVIKSDDEVDRFSLYIMRNLVIASQNERTLKEMGLRSTSEALGYRVAVKSVERIADHALSIAEKVKEVSKPESMIIEKVKELSNIALSTFEDSIESLLRRDYELADKVAEKASTVRDLESKVLEAISRHRYIDLANYRLILEDIRRTAEYASDIAEVAMNQTINDVIIL